MKTDKLTKKQIKELEKLTKDMVGEAKKVVKDYKENPSEISGSVIMVHENSPYLKEKNERLITFGGKQMKIKSDVD